MTSEYCPLPEVLNIVPGLIRHWQVNRNSALFILFLGVYNIKAALRHLEIQLLTRTQAAWGRDEATYVADRGM